MKGQPYFRASLLTKRYGFGIHSDSKGKIAIFAADSEAYAKFVADKSIDKVQVIRSTKA